jgi:hypothetical protein
MTITNILNFANKYNLSDEARDELIKMVVLDENKSQLNTTPYNPNLGPSGSISNEHLQHLWQNETPQLRGISYEGIEKVLD